MVEIVVAYILDVFIGDPLKFPHPIRWIGNLIAKLEPRFRGTFTSLRVAGFFFSLTIILLVFFTAQLILYITLIAHPIFYSMTCILMIFYCFSIKSLADSAQAVYICLKESTIDDARKALSMIVGRDTKELEEREIVRATVETVSENSVDGFISPLFYAMLGGPAFALTYKAINTLDSMVGYKNEKYVDFGWASARMDDIANYIPARISVFIIAFASLIYNYAFIAVIKSGFIYGRCHTSPNSGFPEASFAGSLKVQLGGSSRYNGKLVEKPLIGEEGGTMTCSVIKDTNRLLFWVSFVSITFCLIISA
ncbi:MAG: cobalamin biosynthesis protein CobD [Nitrospinae bacterium]|nr:cobalamin biosynthesis protein CobD [Nitrospinota bacterium]